MLKEASQGVQKEAQLQTVMQFVAKRKRKKENGLQLNTDLCAMHHNDSHKKLRARCIPAVTSEREAYV